MIIVGVKSKRLKEICEVQNNIRPLHICQSISCNISNLRTAVERNDNEWVKELNKERHQLYIEAYRDCNLNMMELNDLMWEEYRYDILKNDKLFNFEMNKFICKCADCGKSFRGFTKDAIKCEECFDKWFETFADEIEDIM